MDCCVGHHVVDDGVFDVEVRGEENDGVGCGAEFHAEGREVACVEREGVACCYADASAVVVGREWDPADGLVLRWFGTCGFDGERFGSPEGDGRDAEWLMRWHGELVAGFAAEAGYFAGWGTG